MERNKQCKGKIELKCLKSSSENETDLKEKKRKRDKKRAEASQKEQSVEKYGDDPGFGEFLKADEKGIRENIISAVHSGSSEADDGEEKQEEDDKEEKIALKKDFSDLDVTIKCEK